MSNLSRFTSVGWRGAVVAVLLIATGSLTATLAIASMTSGHDDLDAGAVTLRVNTNTTTTCHISNLVAGDRPSPSPCRFSVSYTGTQPAFVALNVAVDATMSAHGQSLYDDGRSDGLTFVITDGHHVFASPTGPGRTGGPCPRATVCWSASDELAAWYDANGAHLIVTRDSPALTWTETPVVPLSLGNAYQGLSATLVLTAEAVAATPNPLPSGCVLDTVGDTCRDSHDFAWN